MGAISYSMLLFQKDRLLSESDGRQTRTTPKVCYIHLLMKASDSRAALSMMELSAIIGRMFRICDDHWPYMATEHLSFKFQLNFNRHM